MFVDVGDCTLFDFDAIAEAVSGMFEAVGFIDGDPDDVKGRGFEDEINRRAVQRGFTPWHTGEVTNVSRSSLRVRRSHISVSALT